MTNFEMYSIIAAAIGGGTLTKILDFLFSKNDTNKFAIDLMEEMRKNNQDAFKEIGALRNEVSNYKLKYEKLQVEYDDLKREFEAYKNRK
jgi:hypothetical protein